jgi:hypothetical protein
MREIKFRARNGLGFWVYWDLFLSPSEWNEKGLSVLAHKTVGQFTGLKDRNGKEIWEGDVVEITSWPPTGEIKTRSEIFWHARPDYGACGFHPLNGLEEYCTPDSVEVIGNVWDHPELIKK